MLTPAWLILWHYYTLQQECSAETRLDILMALMKI